MILLAAAFSPACPVYAQGKQEAASPYDYGRVKETISEIIKKEMRKNDVVGLSIALVDDQRIVWSQGFGYSDEAGDVPATPETLYRVGSLTKLFTATAVMQLAEQGKLSIDRPLKEYLPEFSIKSRFKNSAPITLRSLMTHHSGLPSRFIKGMFNNKPEPFIKVTDLLKQEYAAYPPDFIFSYSNIGYNLLGHVLQKISGREFSSRIDEALLKPMSMVHSGFSPSPGKNGALSKGYHKGKEIVEPPIRDTPAGGLHSTVTDLARFMQMAFAQGRAGSRQIIKPETLSEMLRPQNNQVPLDLGLRTGLGWMLSGFGEIDVRNAGPVAHHAGATLMFRSQLIILPAHRLGVVVLANSSSSAPTINMTAARALTLALEIKTGIRQPELVKPAESDTPLSREVMQAYEGRYATIIGVGSITGNDDHLDAEVRDRNFRLVPLAEGGFGARYRFLNILPIRLGELDYASISRETLAGREILVATSRGRKILIGEKIRPAPVSEAWQRRTGDYAIANPGNDFPMIEKIRLRFDSGLLLAEYSMPLLFKGMAVFALDAVSDAEAIVCGLGQNMGETIRALTVNGREELCYSGYVLRKK